MIGFIDPIVENKLVHCTYCLCTIDIALKNSIQQTETCHSESYHILYNQNKDNQQI